MIYNFIINEAIELQFFYFGTKSLTCPYGFTPLQGNVHDKVKDLYMIIAYDNTRTWIFKDFKSQFLLIIAMYGYKLDRLTIRGLNQCKLKIKGLAWFVIAMPIKG